MILDKLTYPKKIKFNYTHYSLDCSLDADIIGNILIEGIRLIQQYNFQYVYVMIIKENDMYCQLIDGINGKFYSDKLDKNMIGAKYISFAKKDDFIYVYRDMVTLNVNRMIEVIYKILYKKVPLYSGNVSNSQLDCDYLIWYNMDYMYIPLKNLVRKITKSIYTKFTCNQDYIHLVRYMNEINSPYLMKNKFEYGHIIHVLENNSNLVYDERDHIFIPIAT